jgi:phosphate starvation-inducible PhoH-like protein
MAKVKKSRPHHVPSAPLAGQPATITRTISLDGLNPVEIYGPGNQHVRLIETASAARITARGTQITIMGVATAVAAAVDLFEALVRMARSGNRLSADDVALLTRLPATEHHACRSGDFPVVVSTQKVVVKPRTPGQYNYIQTIAHNDVVFAIGPAGTGKTFLAVCLAVSHLLDGTVDRVVFTRPAVEAGESIGFLPGDMEEKVAPYLRPLYDALFDLLPQERVSHFITNKIIEIIPLGYMRGRTINNSFIILDEAQNTTPLQMKMFLTRLGVNSKAIITGDITQIDLSHPQESGLIKIQPILRDVLRIKFVYLDKTDVVRHQLVRDIVQAYEQHEHDGRKV